MTTMICNRCLRTAIQRPAPSLLRRNLTTSTPTYAAVSPNAATQAAPRSGSSSSSHTPSAATSTGAAQPFSTPLSPSPDNSDLPINKNVTQASAPLAVKSSVAAGTPLKGLNFIKGKNDPVALEDTEYPSWLWGILGKKAGKGGSADGDAGAASLEGDLFSKSKKQRRIAAKALRKQQLMNPEALAPKIPLHEQTIDLPAGDGSLEGAIEALEARDALTKAMRKNRRAKIKEANFLKAMG